MTDVHADTGTVDRGTAAPLLILSSSGLTDRMLAHSTLFRELSEWGPVLVWATSFRDAGDPSIWDQPGVSVERFPAVDPLRYRYDQLRRLNESAWDYALKPPSRLSMDRHVFASRRRLDARAIRGPARLAALARSQRIVERGVRRIVTKHAVQDGVVTRLRSARPAAVLTMDPFFWPREPAVVAAAVSLDIPVFAFITSWDNLSTKTRLLHDYDAYFVWSTQAREELKAFYPHTAGTPVHEVGAPQFDVFDDRRFREPKEVFLRRHCLDPARPIITYALGSPNFLAEHHGALEFAHRVCNGELGDAQLLVRPHPFHDRNATSALFERFGPRVVVQFPADSDRPVTERSQDDHAITDWVSTFRHSDVVVNLSSTVTVDAAIFDTPVVNLDFDPAPGHPQQALVKDVNHAWTHFSPIASSGGVWLAQDMDDVMAGVRAYLADPGLHAEARRWIVGFVCGQVDGRAGARLAQGLVSELERVGRRRG